MASPSVLRTPRSSRRRSLFPHLENLLDSPTSSQDGLIKMGLSSASPRSKKKLPAKFKQEMPRRSLNSDENKSPETVKCSPIKKSTFYGSYKPKFVFEDRTSEETNLDDSFKKKMTLETPPKILKITKRKKELTKSAPVSRSSKKYGINKGVSHAIKKPKVNPKKADKAKSGKFDSNITLPPCID